MKTRTEKRRIYAMRNTYAKPFAGRLASDHSSSQYGTSTAMLEKHYGHTSNVASAAELTKGGKFKGDKRVKAVDWL